MARKPVPFTKEADLCAAFAAAIGDKWIAFNETAGYDILLVRKADGFQIGIQAKLKLNTFVLAQALEQYSFDAPGPDCRAIMVPWSEVSVGLSYLCAYIGVTIIRVDGSKETRARSSAFSPELPVLSGRWSDREWYEWAPSARCPLPEYVPDVPAGARAPLQLTPWKINALKIAVLLETRGFVTRKDFAHLRLDHRRWIARENRWLKVVDGGFVPGDRLPNFKAQHPVVFEQIKADAIKWMPTTATAAGEQPAMI